jgi:hypothetical protein
MRILVVVCLMVGVAHAAPADVAKKIIDAQVAGAQTSDDSFEKTFAPDAIVNDQEVSGLGTLKVELFNHASFQIVIKGIKVRSLTAGGDAKLVWFAGELEVTTAGVTGQDDQTGDIKTGPATKHTVRFSELAVAEGARWRVVAAQFAEPGTPKREKTGRGTMSGETKADQLSRIVISPSALANGLAKDATAIVFGTDNEERGIGGPAAKKLVESWKPLKLEIDGKVREVRTATYGFVQANVNWVKPGGDPYRMRALLIATPDPTGTWTIRVVHYAVR